MKVLLSGILLVLLAMVLLVGCEGEITSVESEENVDSEEALLEEIDQGDKEDVEGADEAAESRSVETQDNSRTSPAGVREKFLVEKDDWLVGRISYEIEMIHVISGEEALNIVKEGNQFNEEPEEGKEYVLAEFVVTVIETEDDDAFDLRMGISWSAISGEGREYTDFFSVSGINRLQGDLYKGASATGYQPFIIDLDDERPVAAHDRRGPTEIWFDLRADQ